MCVISLLQGVFFLLVEFSGDFESLLQVLELVLQMRFLIVQIHLVVHDLLILL